MEPSPPAESERHAQSAVPTVALHRPSRLNQARAGAGVSGLVRSVSAHPGPGRPGCTAEVSSPVGVRRRCQATRNYPATSRLGLSYSGVTRSQSQPKTLSRSIDRLSSDGSIKSSYAVSADRRAAPPIPRYATREAAAPPKSRPERGSFYCLNRCRRSVELVWSPNNPGGPCGGPTRRASDPRRTDGLIEMPCAVRAHAAPGHQAVFARRTMDGRAGPRHGRSCRAVAHSRPPPTAHGRP